MPHEPDIQSLFDQLDATARDARAVADGLSGDLGEWRPAPGAWSVAECLDHLATTNRVYIEAMRPAAERARGRGRLRRGPATPGLIGSWFVRSMEPPVKRKLKAPQLTRPQDGPRLTGALDAFLESQDGVRAFLDRFAEIDLAGTHFPNPFVRAVRFSLATGLHVIPAHERRHLWQAWTVRREAEGLSTRNAERGVRN